MEFGAAFKRIAIVNRGEPAMRLINAVREINAEYRAGLCTIALYTHTDASSMFVREADEALLLGPAMYDDPAGGRQSTYLNYQRLKEALTQCRAEAAWVGWGFVAEHGAFADLCQSLGIVFIGPSGQVMRQLGDKIASKRLAEAAAVPVLPWSGGPVEDVEAALSCAAALGYPVMIKATAGGGGRGIRRVAGPKDLSEAFARARAEAKKAFGDGTVFLEKAAGIARHVEVQVVGDRAGAVWAVGVRDCSVQRRNQKVVEEAPSPILTPATEAKIRDAARRLAQKVGYVNAGTVEFLVEAASQSFYFMEVNTRLQVEHPVTELTTGLDLVKLQLHLAGGGCLHGAPPQTTGHAIEARLNAEDPDNDFAPSPGLVRLFRAASGPGVRVDTGVRQGDVVAPEFDSMVAKIIVHGASRTEALARLERVLRETAVVIESGATNKAFLLRVLTHADVLASRHDVGWLDANAKALTDSLRAHAEAALVYAGVRAYQEALGQEYAEFARTAARGRPVVRQEVERPAKLRYQSQDYTFRIQRTAAHRFRVRVDGVTIDAALDVVSPFESWLLYHGQRHRIVAVHRGAELLVEVDGDLHKVMHDDGGAIRAPSPAMVVAVDVKVGDPVTAGQRLLVLEAMKTEMALAAPAPGRVRELHVRANVVVAAGAPLLVIEYAGTETKAAVTPRVSFAVSAPGAAAPPSPQARCLSALHEISQFMLGYDVTPQEVAAKVDEYVASRRQVSAADAEILAHEDTVLEILVDVLRLHSRDPAGQGALPYRECLVRFIRTIDARGAGLPDDFMRALRRALRHYGVKELDRTERLEEGLLLIHKAYAHWGERLQPCMRVLETRLELVDSLRAGIGVGFKDLLDRIVLGARDLSLAMHDLALQVRFHYFDVPVLDVARTRAYQQIDAEMQAFRNQPSPERRQQLLSLMTASPFPLTGLLARWLDAGVAGLRPAILKVLVERYYRSYVVESLETFEHSGFEFVTAMVRGQDRTRRVAGVLLNRDALPRAITAMRALGAASRPTSDTLVEFFVSTRAIDGSLKDIVAELAALVGDAPFGEGVGRICFTFMSGERQRAVDHVTFARVGDRYQELTRYRGIHPIRAGELETWRLRNFDIERLPSPEDVFLCRAVARDNRKDVRLFVFAEIRDVTPTVGEDGGPPEIPHFERMALLAFSCLRDRQYKSPPRERLHSNRVILHVAPPLELDPDVGRDVLKRLAPSTRNLGLDKVVVRTRCRDPKTGAVVEKAVHHWFGGDRLVRMQIRDVGEEPIRPLNAYDQRVAGLHARGLSCPYDIASMLAPKDRASEVGLPCGEFAEHDLDAANALVPVQRPPGDNAASIVVGIIKNFTAKHPDGMTRVILLGDPTKGMGALAEPECRRVIEALNLAERLRVPLEWFPVSAGAKISMDSGTENLDWTARVLRRIVEFVQQGGEINIVVDAINVGAQSYWNAEATMLPQARGVLIMTPRGAMVLTGKHALDFSGSVSAEDNRGIGGVEQIMGQNGEAQYFAHDLAEACAMLFGHYQHTYVSPGERFPRRNPSTDPHDRDVAAFPYPAASGEGFERVGDIFSAAHNPQRKRPFAIRTVMQAVADQDVSPLERWPMMREAEMSVVWDASLGGIPVALIGIESRQVSRGGGVVPGDGPETFSGGTLYPLSSKKLARAINAASGNRPLVVLANLSGFDGSPEALRKLQLEYGAEIGRAVVRFRGPMVFCVISRYHGGAYVVFSRALNDQLQAVALEGSFASVIGGAPAAAVVFAGEVDEQVYADPEVKRLQAALSAADAGARHLVLAELGQTVKAVRETKRIELAKRFDAVHTVQRAKAVGSIDDILPVQRLRPYLIEMLERAIAAG
ncbi:MAG: ATP-grasp domain-containing protein [Deltaproteobacteria bacterium]|nr:ATP-grasp domain-containing protein [Deltaproteobacteria bacterium]